MWVRKRSSCSSIGFYIYGEIAFLPLNFAGLVPIFFLFYSYKNMKKKKKANVWFKKKNEGPLE